MSRPHHAVPKEEAMNWTELLEKLAEPFPPAAIQWRAGATNKDRTRAQALPYVDPREYERRLDALCPGEWSVEFQPWGEGRIICRLTIHGVTRSSTGESDGEGFAIGTAAEAQAFKRACSKFGLGRYLYDIEAPWVAYDHTNKRLAETPRLPKPPTTAPAQAPQPEPASEPTLSRERASRMHRELGRLGFKHGEHYEVCRHALGRNVTSLTTLTDEEARRCWSYAREQARRRRAVSDEEAAAVLN